MSEEDFIAYRERLTAFCMAFIDEVETKESQPMTHAVAHHTFLNPIIMCDINEKRVAAGKPAIPFSIFAHGTALKMFHNEFPMRFTPLVREVMAPNKADCKQIFIISEAERAKLIDAYGGTIESDIILSPNGVNLNIFKPTTKTREEVLGGLKSVHYEGSATSVFGLSTQTMLLGGTVTATSVFVAWSTSLLIAVVSDDRQSV